jgi:putative restriction endonuclease
MTPDEFHQKLTNINVWKRGEQRAPHKPLLLLLAMGRAVRGEQRLALFSEIDEALTGLLRHFGPPRRRYHPEFPFRYLTNDGLWEIPNASLIDEARRGWGKKALRDRGIIGGLPKSLYLLLVADSASAREAADLILDEHFPDSMHQHILEAVGLEGIASKENTTSPRPQRDPRFRHLVLTAYERRCAICGFDLRLEDDLLGLEAAHIQWHSHGGPDRVTNGLALCTFHHGAFDRGAIGLERAAGGAGYRMLVSGDVNGTSGAVRWLLDYHGQPVRPPQKGAGEPRGDYVAWHTKEVFRSPARGL